MKMTILKVLSNPKVLNMVSMSILAISTYGANTRCMCIFHEVDKPKTLEGLKKY